VAPCNGIVVEILTLEAMGSILTAVATIALVILLWRTIKQFEATVRVSEIQTKYRFRPWIGPNNSIKPIPSNKNGKHKFDVGIKNFGEIPAAEVHVHYKIDTKLITKEDLNQNDVDHFNLGPMLPNMEKHYWFFIDSELIQKAKEGKEQIFTGVFFEYQVAGNKNGYGMISQYIPESDSFIHKQMWVDTHDDLSRP